MKFVRTIAVAAVVLCAGLQTGAAVGAEIEALSQVTSVVVFPSGAEVARTSKLKLVKGDHTLLFRDLPSGAIEGSIRVEGNATGKLEIGSVDTRRAFLSRADTEASAGERKRLEGEIEQIRDERALLEALVQSAEAKRSLINNLTQLPTRPAPAGGADQKGEDWGAILALIGAGIPEAQREQKAAEIKMRELDRRIEDLEKKLAMLAPPQVERTEAKVFVSAQADLEADVTVRYQVSQASWTPLYDVRLSTGGKTEVPKINLARRAAITQQTGEAWTGVELSLSTTRPSSGAAAPELRTVSVDFPPPEPPRPAPMAMSTRDSMAEAAPQMGDEPAEAQLQGGVEETSRPRLRAMKVASAPVNAQVIAAPFHATYAVPGRVDIPDSGETKRVQLLDETIEPALTVRTVPKVDAKAYLIAKFSLPKGSPLLPGTAALFRDGTFVGQGRLPLLSPGEEHELGFGADDLVRVRYAVAEEKRGESGIISTSRTDSRNFRISIKSLHERVMALSVIDQVPVSAQEDIKVELVSKIPPSRQNVDDKRGVMAWDMKLEPDQEQVIDFGYRVMWPAAKTVIYR